MFTNGELIVLPNPRTAVASVARSLSMWKVEVAFSERHPTTNEIAKALGNSWRRQEKLLVVRDPIERFISAAHLAISEVPSEEFLEELVTSLEVLSVSEWDRIWWPQRFWMTRRIDYVVGLPWLHEFFNHMQFPTLRVEGKLGPRSAPRDSYAGDLLDRVASLYEMDYSWFDKNPVWHPEPNGVRFLLTGNCVECEKKRKRYEATTIPLGDGTTLPD